MTNEASKHQEATQRPASQASKDVLKTSGSVSKFLYNAHGDSDGFLLDGERQVHFPPHLSSEVLKKVKLGDKVDVHGEMLPEVGLTIATSIDLPGGAKIVDHGPNEKHPKG